MKKATQSKTMQTAAALMTAAITTLILHYTQAIVVTPAALGAAWSTVVSSVVMVALRLATSTPIGSNVVENEEGEP
jgi:hypothetical protein